MHMMSTQPLPVKSKRQLQAQGQALTQPTISTTVETQPQTQQPHITKVSHNMVLIGTSNGSKAPVAPNTGNGQERSRSNSSTALQVPSNESSQSYEHSQTKVVINGLSKKHAPPKQSELSEHDAHARLNILMRRYLLAYLSSTITDDLARDVLTNMKAGHKICKDARSRVRSLFKQWKATIHDAALAWVRRWIATAKA